jgi:GNAT superfamily N-acetyltransferase
MPHDALRLAYDDYDSFFSVPFNAYPATSPYVSPLKSDLTRSLDVRRNPLFGAEGKGKRRVITAHHRGKPVGRIVAHTHGASNERYAERRASFGYFDCVDDFRIASVLLEAAEEFARDEGCNVIAGNFNLTAMQQMGIVTEGFESRPYSDMVWNPPHMPRLLERYGFDSYFPARTYEFDLREFDPESLLKPRIVERLEDTSLIWERLEARDFASALEKIRLILNDGFQNNAMFVPLTSAEILFQARDLAHVIDPAITALVHDDYGPAGVVLSMPDLNPMFRAMRSRLGVTAPWHFLRHRATRKRAVIVFASVAQRQQNNGLNGAMLYHVTRAMQQRGYESVGITWVADHNGASVRQVERLGARPMHRIHLYQKPVSGL